MSVLIVVVGDHVRLSQKGEAYRRVSHLPLLAPVPLCDLFTLEHWRIFARARLWITPVLSEARWPSWETGHRGIWLVGTSQSYKGRSGGLGSQLWARACEKTQADMHCEMRPRSNSNFRNMDLRQRSCLPPELEKISRGLLSPRSRESPRERLLRPGWVWEARLIDPHLAVHILKELPKKMPALAAAPAFADAAPTTGNLCCLCPPPFRWNIFRIPPPQDRARPSYPQGPVARI